MCQVMFLLIAKKFAIVIIGTLFVLVLRKSLLAEDYKTCFSATCKRVKHYTKALLDVVPRNFSQKYRNPCWHSPLHIPHDLSDYFQGLRAIRRPMFSNTSDHVFQKSNISYTLSVIHTQNQHRQKFYCLPLVHLAAFPKCGTTALYQMLTHHPSVAKPLRKEGHFWSTFTEDNGTYEDKLLHSLWYLHQFQSSAQQISKSPRSITIDASPSTLWRVLHKFEEESDMSVLPSVINQLTPTARFIVIMRNPVQRLFSDFWFFCSHQNWARNGHVVVPNSYLENGRQIFHNLSAESILRFHSCVFNFHARISVYYECVRRAAVGDENSRSTSCFQLRIGIGMYYYHITRWLRVIPRERFLFLRSEDLSLDPYSTMERVWRFLDLPPQTRQQMEASLARRHEWNTNDWIKSEEYRERFAMLPETERILREFYRPHNEKLAELLSDPHYLWN